MRLSHGQIIDLPLCATKNCCNTMRTHYFLAILLQINYGGSLLHTGTTPSPTISMQLTVMFCLNSFITVNCVNTVQDDNSTLQNTTFSCRKSKNITTVAPHTLLLPCLTGTFSSYLNKFEKVLAV